MNLGAETAMRHHEFNKEELAGLFYQVEYGSILLKLDRIRNTD
jgi:hypothetical protein